MEGSAAVQELAEEAFYSTTVIAAGQQMYSPSVALLAKEASQEQLWIVK